MLQRYANQKAEIVLLLWNYITRQTVLVLKLVTTKVSSKSVMVNTVMLFLVLVIQKASIKL